MRSTRCPSRARSTERMSSPSRRVGAKPTERTSPTWFESGHSWYGRMTTAGPTAGLGDREESESQE